MAIAVKGWVLLLAVLVVLDGGGVEAAASVSGARPARVVQALSSGTTVTRGHRLKPPQTQPNQALILTAMPGPHSTYRSDFIRGQPSSSPFRL